MSDQNSDKLLAQTHLALAMDLMSSSAPISTAKLRERHVPEVSKEAARKKLTRAREALESCGLRIVYERSHGTYVWSVDPCCYPSGSLEPTDADVVRLLCTPLLSDEGFAHRGDLRYALMKLDASPTRTNTPPPLQDDHVLETLRYCLSSQLKVELDYEDAHGNETHRKLAPLGLFDLRGRTYLVCDTAEGARPENIRTLRCDRISHARKTRSSYTYPKDFDVNEYRLLPFQIGTLYYDCTFRVIGGATAQLIEATLGKGRLYRDGEDTLWDVKAADLDDAAAWGLAHKLIPVAPSELVLSWRNLLRGCLA